MCWRYATPRQNPRQCQHALHLDVARLPTLWYLPKLSRLFSQILIVLHAFLASSVLLPTLSATSNIVQNPINGAPPLSFYKVLAHA